jgi:hypothetical protein
MYGSLRGAVKDAFLAPACLAHGHLFSSILDQPWWFSKASLNSFAETIARTARIGSSF